AIQQLNTVIQQNASASEEMASTAEELSSQAEQLIETISFFKVDDSQVRSVKQKLPDIKKEMKSLQNIKTVKNRTIASDRIPVYSGKGVIIDMGEDKIDRDFERFS
ncbi:MAG: hypothetical protein ACM34K_08865, partial [Bacillota bacterium]